jgi:BirA family biotin operon repressor/biotin-[acetyl-CoA-carboxylase] ligase
MALGLAEVFEASGVKLGIKWPNDLYYHGKKLAGILCEMVCGHLLIGVGVNVNNPVPESAAALRGWSLERVDEVALEGLRRGLELLAAPQDISERFSRYDLLYGQRVEGEKGRGALAQGVDREGRLLLRDEAGRLEPFWGHLVAFSLAVGP